MLLKHGPKRMEGFALIEIMVVVIIIALLAVLALPSIQKAKQSAQTKRIISDFRTFAGAFEVYALENGNYPPDGAFNSFPAEMQDALGGGWLNPPMGGQWIWDYNDHGITAGVSYRETTASNAQMLEVDRRLDDGDLSTGFFQKIQSDRFTLILEH